MSITVQAAARISQLRNRIPAGRKLIISGDGGYTNRTICRSLPPDTTFLGRIRKDAKLFLLPDDIDGRGRKRIYGKQLPTPEAMRLDDAVPWQEVKAVTGGHDQTIGALGAGVVEEGSAMYAAGSVECLCPVVSRLTLSPELCRNNLCCYDYSLPDRYTSVAYSLTGSNLLQYFREQFGADLSYDALLAELPSTPTSLLALPYFTPSGTPYFDQLTPGAVLGWRLTTSRGELLKSLLEAVALEMKLNLELLGNSGMKIDRLIATGGGSRNRQLVQLKADVLNKPIEQIEVSEAGCLGAARLARSADMNIPVLELVRREFRTEQKIMPDPDRAEQYQHKFEQYKLFYSSIKNLAGTMWSK